MKKENFYPEIDSSVDFPKMQEKILEFWNDGHWDYFVDEVSAKGIERAALDRFNGYVISKNDAINDPLPMQEAFKLFKEIINGQ